MTPEQLAAMEQALEALEKTREKNAAAQPAYDQTALELCEVCGWKTLIPGDVCLNCEHEAAAQRQWVGLTRQDIDIAFDDTQEGGGFDEFAYAIEQRLKEKNHA